MSDRNIEKSLLYLVLLSVLLHVAVFWAVSKLPKEPPHPEEATIVDLKDIPDLPLPPPPAAQPAPPKAVPPARREPRPAERPRIAPVPSLPRTAQQAPAPSESKKALPSRGIPAQPKADLGIPARPTGREEAPRRESAGREPSRGEGLFKPQRGRSEELARLYPSTRGIQRIEENFRKKYEDAEQGDTRLMDTDDPNIGTFTRRFAIALRDRLNSIDRYERKGVGMTVLTIRIGRDGMVESTRILYTSGNAKLDELATKAANSASYVGPLPRKWDHETLNLICSFVIREGGGISASWELSNQ
ncbi:hypothetical protein GMST_04270 [Geomonas silvestris]|uniref:TonB C-terminal domain-containing protein n=1 Tax=Geomonas silvestris TaxID=2740184 RepID=A0A6V8MDS9_9BACT|nr:energy transducer TonB [Geomonas silvestris]GFO58102.1 hypothetical protein GMST_04270 [Geomonas silvestris]